jgi:hypothetical protein
LVIGLFLSLVCVKSVHAQGGYVISRFDSAITINQDTSIDITETVNANFSEQRHGIYRDIPSVYKIEGKRINSNLSVKSVTDQSGNVIPYSVSKNGDYKRIKIGDPDKLIFGEQVYVISYTAQNILQKFPDHTELYWNVAGSNWDTQIQNASAQVISKYANITQVKCFSGSYGSTQQECNSHLFSDDTAQFSASKPIGSGSDLTIVVALDNNNSLIFPGVLQQLWNRLINNFGYFVAPIPLFYMLISWWKKGRDKRYLSENVYYEPDDKRTKSVGLFKRAHLPLTYSPIDNVSAGELGTIVDERVDIRDVVAEICELARMKYIKIEVIKKKKLLRDSVDYKFIKLDKDTEDLRDYQLYLYKKLFVGGESEVLLSDLDKKFYKYLPDFKKKIYEWVSEQGYFDGNPDKVRIKWFVKAMVLTVLGSLVLYRYFDMVGNVMPLILFGLLSTPAFLIAFIMPRKTAKGYSMHRQAKGLEFYINKGKWREEIAEKQLFFAEMLPLAISLGVVKKLTNEMDKLGVKPPSYIGGVSNAYIYSNLASMDSKVSHSLVASPKSSGGSGFGGGGFSGGGFGGGGGGSW